METTSSTTTGAHASPSDRELVITRIFDAPRELVFKAWAEPERWVHWLGLRGCSGKVLQTARQPGDAYRYLMRDPEGGDHWLQGVFREFVEPERLVFTWGFANAQWQPTDPETIVTLTFEDVSGKTRLTLRHGIFETVSACELHNAGWNDSFDRVGEYLATVR
jgi:uncharacterized protein YndB with AHSA1/START domain